MQYVIGFVIALFIALTGVGAGTITVPVLVLFLGVPAPVAVGIGLMFATAVKLILVPSQIVRRNVAWRTLGFMLAGRRAGRDHRVAVPEAPGHGRVAEPAECAARRDSGDHGKLADLRPFRPLKQNPNQTRSQPLAGLADVAGGRGGRFFLRRSGRAGQRALLSLTPLVPAQVVGTDIAFGFIVSLIGSGAHWFSHASNPDLLIHLIAGGVSARSRGTLLSTRVPRRPLRFALWVWLLILGGQFLFNSYQAWAAPQKALPSPTHIAKTN